MRSISSTSWSPLGLTFNCRVFFFGKILEALGCADVGFALYVGLTQEHGMGKELELAAVGMLVFGLGVLAERWSAQ